MTSHLVSITNKVKIRTNLTDEKRENNPNSLLADCICFIINDEAPILL